MAAATVSANNTRLNTSDSNAGWSNEGGGGPSPASEPQLRYQGTNAVNRKTTSTGSRQGVQYNHGSTTDMTAAANALLLAKAYIADFGDLNTTWGVEIALGSAVGARYGYNVAGSGANRAVFGAYPAQGGYLIIAINPNVAAWREATTGSPSLTAVDHFMLAAQFVSGGAKSENLALDAIDIGTGLTIIGGDGADPDGTFDDFVTFDEGTTSNRFGYVVSQSGIIYVRGLLTIGTATATVFDGSSASVVVFPDGYHGAGDVGLAIDLSSASTAIVIASTLIGRGSSASEDTRPDLVVTGTSGTLDLQASLQNFRNVVLTSGVTVDGAIIQCADIAQGAAEIRSSTIITTSASGVAACNDPTFGASGLHDSTLEQGGAGHAIEIGATGTLAIVGLKFVGYGADDTNAAAIYNDSGGLVTINISGGGDTPTIRNGTGASTIVNNAINHTLTGIVEGSEVTYVRVSDNLELFHVESTGAGGTVTYAYSATGVDVRILVFHEDYEAFSFSTTLGTSDQTIPINQISDRVFSNP